MEHRVTTGIASFAAKKTACLWSKLQQQQNI
jgi:hypothetical protein